MRDPKAQHMGALAECMRAGRPYSFKDGSGKWIKNTICDMLSILDKDFKYVPEAETDIRKVFRRARKDMQPVTTKVEPLVVDNIVAVPHSRWTNRR